MGFPESFRDVHFYRSTKSFSLIAERPSRRLLEMNTGYAELESADRIVARFLCEYYKIWQAYFPGLNKRAHWHVIFSARMSTKEGISCRAIHRTLYGFYGTDIRTCIERVKDCESDGFIGVFDTSNQPCPASAGCLIRATDKLYQSFDRHCRDTIDEACSVFGDAVPPAGTTLPCDDAAISAIFQFFGAYDRKWRETSEHVVREKGLTPAHLNDAMDHLVTYQYWAIVMLLWRASPLGNNHSGAPALVIDEINSKMWDALRLGHLAIKERVGNLIRWGFFAEGTIKRHKAVSLTAFAGSAIIDGLAETRPLLDELHAKLVSRRPEPVSARIA